MRLLLINLGDDNFCVYLFVIIHDDDDDMDMVIRYFEGFGVNAVVMCDFVKSYCGFVMESISVIDMISC